MTPQEAKTIREAYEFGYDVRALAQDYEVPARTIRRILRGETFKDAGGPLAPVDSTRLHQETRAAVLTELAKPYWRGRDRYLRDKYDLSYEMLADLKAEYRDSAASD